MKKVYVWLMNGFADWEASYVCAELNKPESGCEVKTIAEDLLPKTSMGGFRVLPELALPADPADLDMTMLILPGGLGWSDSEADHAPAASLVRFCFEHGIEVAAICDATTFLGKHGFLDHDAHTGNTLEYLKLGAPAYAGDKHYIDAQAVSSGSLITANGSGAVEFSKLILAKLEVLQGEALEQWYHIFKQGYFSEVLTLPAIK
ncbi:glutamine amidotransferase [Paenibacillaceae bacterium]|nr:glutamine amidotransferase [Paenibacillaceae bacterium]